MLRHSYLLTRRICVALALLAVGVTLLAAGAARAADSSQSIAQGFQPDGDSDSFVAGALVSTKPGSSGTVQLATTSSAESLVGVLDSNPLLVISGGKNEAQVVLSGSTAVLVSDINGPINNGDKITTSPIAGVGMLATTDTRVAGIAQSAFDASKGETRTIKDSRGEEREVHIGYVPLQVGVAFYQAPGSNFLPPFIQDVANAIAGRPVALLRVLLGTVIVLFGMISIGIFIYSSVRSAVVSLGRNPLAAHDIRKTMYQVGGLALAFLGGTLLAGYLVVAL